VLLTTCPVTSTRDDTSAYFVVVVRRERRREELDRERPRERPT
jgi:hypothetical protein